MRLFALVLLLSLAFLASPARAQSGPDDQYVAIYGLMQQADSLASGGQPRQALTEYQSALSELQKFATVYPTWNPHIITFRLSYLADKIAATSALLPGGSDVAPTVAAPPVVVPPAVVPAATAPDAGLAAQLAALRSQVQNLQADNAGLVAKLKEAFSAQPTAIDPRELAAAQDKVRFLMKENDLLRVSLIKGKNPAEAGLVLVESNALVKAQSELADLSKQLALEVKLSARFSQENKTLSEQVKSLQGSSEGIQALREENALLKKQLAEAKAAAKKSRADERLKADLEKAQAKIDGLQAAAKANALEKAALEARVKQLELAAANSPVAAGQTENEARIRDLEKQVDALKLNLIAAGKSRPGKMSRAEVNTKIEQLTEQVKTLQARVAADESQPVPYTEEELALFRQESPVPLVPVAGKKSAPTLPGGSTELVVSAQSHFAAHEYDQAANDYLKILQHDENNGLVLANLAAVELQAGRLADAEKHIQAAVAQTPDDAYNLTILGNLKFQQEKYDEAMNVLGKASQLEPQNPEILNLLGVTLGHKGLRLPAETALRKALLIDPNYASAHNNLAVIYVSEQPPRAELARWHYLKALAAGQPHNTGLEKILADNGAAIPAQ